MGQILGQDRIATPSHSSGTITLPPSLLTLGGRQYRTSTLSRLISADVTLAANTLYFVYAQIVAGVPALRISLSPPSLYRIANPSAMLVTAFQSTGSFGISVGFGSFFQSIDGPPRSLNPLQYGTFHDSLQFLLHSGYTFSGLGTPWTPSSIARNTLMITRDGDELHYTAEFSGALAGGNGFIAFNFAAYPIDPIKYGLISWPASDQLRKKGAVGTWHCDHIGFVGTELGIGVSHVYDGTRIIHHATAGANLGAPNQGWQGNGYWGSNGNGINAGYKGRFYVQGWSNTPLKDL